MRAVVRPVVLRSLPLLGGGSSSFVVLHAHVVMYLTSCRLRAWFVGAERQRQRRLRRAPTSDRTRWVLPWACGLAVLRGWRGRSGSVLAGHPKGITGNLPGCKRRRLPLVLGWGFAACTPAEPRFWEDLPGKDRTRPQPRCVRCARPEPAAPAAISVEEFFVTPRPTAGERVCGAACTAV